MTVTTDTKLRGRTRTIAACLNASFEDQRRAAWSRFVTDYVGAVDDDPGDARQRYWQEIARIEREEARLG